MNIEADIEFKWKSVSRLLEQQLRVLQDLASFDNWVGDKVDRVPIDAESHVLHFVRYLIH